MIKKIQAQCQECPFEGEIEGDCCPQCDSYIYADISLWDLRCMEYEMKQKDKEIKELNKKMKDLEKKSNRCKYCGGKTNSPDPDALCNVCKNVFDHSYFSEL